MNKIIIAANICLLGGLITVAFAGESKISLNEQNKADISRHFLPSIARERDSSLAISVEMIMQKLKEKQQVVFIDVRGEKEFKKNRIPGSLNIPLQEIKDKNFLKNKQFIFYNKGDSYRKMEEECERLKEAGFKSFFILEGGLLAWKEKGGNLEGNIYHSNDLNKMKNQDLFLEKNYTNLKIINICILKDESNLLPDAEHIPLDSENFLDKIRNKIDTFGQGKLSSVLIVNENGDYDQIEKNILIAGLNNVFFLEGGLGGYTKFCQEQSLILETKGNLKIPKFCKDCL